MFFLGKLEKESACLDLMKQAGVTAEQTAYIGDDSVDLPAFATCGLSFAVADSAPYVQMLWIMCFHLAAEKVHSVKCPI